MVLSSVTHFNKKKIKLTNKTGNYVNSSQINQADDFSNVKKMASNLHQVICHRL